MTAPHDKLAGIKPGDRVRVTFEGVLKDRSPDTTIVMVETDQGVSDACVWMSARATFQIERIEPPLKVGDRVRIDGEEIGKVLAVSDGLAWVRSDSGIHLSWVVESLERIA